MSSFAKLKPYLEKLHQYSYLVSILNYDLSTTTPSKAIDEESELLLEMMSKRSELMSDPAFIALLQKTQEEEKSNPMIQALCKNMLKSSLFLSSLPKGLNDSWNQAYQESTNAWRIAKEKCDYSIYLPKWKKAIEAKRDWAKRKKTEAMSTVYDACLDDFEPGLREEEVDRIFNPLKEFLIANLPEVMKRQAECPAILPHKKVDQENLSYAVLKLIGYRLEEGAFRESEHPFSDTLARHDARITTHYYEEDWRSNLYSVIHEGGHAIQFQNWSSDMWKYHVAGFATAALCETHSRLFENLLGRSHEFAHVALPLAKKHLKKEFKHMSEDEFYAAVNHVSPSLIRTEADEWTYSLHIIIRYEIERDLINGKIECEDVPEIWNRKYKDYLGVDVPNDALGLMQDIHWSDASIGYFPTYALGNLYGAQILDTMNKDFDVYEEVKNKRFKTIIAWLAKNDYAYDWMDPNDWIVQVTGKKLDSKYFVDYLTKKYLKA